MDFRWVALTALWTIIAGPLFGPSVRPTPATPSAAASVKQVAATAPRPAR